MAKVLSLFNVEEIKAAKAKNPPDNILPIIPLANKKASKNDSPLEKEMRRFNRLIKELHEYEENKKNKQANEEKYNQLYVQNVVPVLTELAALQLKFIKQLESVFYTEANTKANEKKFIFFIIDLLENAAMFNSEAKKLLQIYFSKQLSFLSKKEKKEVEKAMNRDGFSMGDNSFENFDFENFEAENKKHFDYERITEEKHQLNKETQAANKNTPPSINELYKELAKQLHPDLENDEDIKLQKQELMKELTAAKFENNLHKMLLLKQKALQFIAKETTYNFYSLDQLKQYNKILKQKIDSNRFSYTSELYNNMYMQNGFLKMRSLNQSAEEKIQQALSELKKIKTGLAKDMKTIKTKSQLLDMINDFDDDDFDELDDFF